jgi:outer membrane protein
MIPLFVIARTRSTHTKKHNVHRLPLFFALIAFVALMPLAGTAQPRPFGNTDPAAQTLFMTLDECVAYALQSRLAVQEARLDIRSADQDVRTILAAAHPQLALNWDLNWFLEIPSQALPAVFVNPNASPDEFVAVKFGTEYVTSVGAQLNQLILDATFFIGLKATRAIVELQKKSLVRSETDAVAEVSKAYYTVLVTRERTRLLDYNIVQIEKLLTDSRALNTAGLVESLDTLRLRVTLNNLRTQQTNARNLSQLTVDLLKFQTGLDPRVKLVLTDSLNLEQAARDTSLTANIEIDPTQRVEYQLLDMTYTLQGYNAQRYRASYYPALYGFGNASTQAFGNQFEDLYFSNQARYFPQVLVGLTLRWNIYDGFANASRAEKARIEQRRTQLQQANFVNAVHLEAQNARTNLDNALRNLTSQRENIALAREVLRVAEVKYTEGIGSNLEVTDANTQLSTAQTNYADAILQAYIARIDLQLAAGALYTPGQYQSYEVDYTR